MKPVLLSSGGVDNHVAAHLAFAHSHAVELPSPEQSKEVYLGLKARMPPPSGRYRSDWGTGVVGAGRVILDGDVESLSVACQIYQAVVRVIAVAGPYEIRGAGELVIAAEHGLRIIHVGVFEDRQPAGRRLETIVVAIDEVRAEATAGLAIGSAALGYTFPCERNWRNPTRFRRLCVWDDNDTTDTRAGDDAISLPNLVWSDGSDDTRPASRP